MQDPDPKCRHFVISWHFMAFWHVCQKAYCITKSAFSAFSRLFHRIRLFSSTRKSLESLSKVSQKSLKSLSNVSQKSLKSLLKVSQKSLKSLSKVSQKSLKSLSKVSQKSCTIRIKLISHCSVTEVSL